METWDLKQSSKLNWDKHIYLILKAQKSKFNFKRINAVHVDRNRGT